ncbi:MAG: hypothetical protein ACK43K_02815 [Chitinophagales bacterium]|jgi:hypothetical protein|nr:hypothetical protein [Sphingobacteriales bacterium]
MPRAYLFILFSFFVVLSSWIRWYSTGTLKADENFIDQSNWALWLCVGLYHIGIYGMIYTLYNIVCNKPNYHITKKQTITISIASMLIFFGMTVMFASDIYTYLAEGELLTRGILTYTNGELVRQSKFIDYVSHWWKDCPNHYGSPLLLLFGISCLIGKSIFKSYLVFKFLIFLIGLLIIQLVSKLEDTENDTEYNYFAIIALSPILMIEGIGQVHAEIVITLLLAATMLSMQKKNIYLAALFIGTAIACKILYGVILFPLFMTLLFVSSKHEKNRWSYFFKNGLICIGILSTMVILLYWPIWEGWATITNPMAYHSTKTPSRSYTEIFILVYRYGSEILANGTTIPELMKLAQSPDFFPISEVISLKNKIAPFFAGLGLLLAILNLLPVLAVKKTNDVYYYFAKLWIIIIVIYSPIFNPWYFMPIILLMIYHRKKSWIFFLIFITSISMNYQIGNSIPLDSLLNLLVTINMVLMLIMFLYKFKLHFIKEPLQEIRGMYRSILVAN